MKKIIAFTGLLLAGAASSFGYTSYATFDSANGNTIAGEYVSPYYGRLNTTPGGGDIVGSTLSVVLFCDDLRDTVSFHQTWQANVATVASLGSSPADLANTRFGAATVDHSNGTPYPTGTQLYEQLAWLFTQSSVRPAADQSAIQEAVWKMTGGPGTPLAPSGTKTIDEWIHLAQTLYASTNGNYATPDFNKWLVITDINAAGNPVGLGAQEFLGYIVGDEPIAASSTPEPATFALFGGAILALGVLRRKRRAKS